MSWILRRAWILEWSLISMIVFWRLIIVVIGCVHGLAWIENQVSNLQNSRHPSKLSAVVVEAGLKIAHHLFVVLILNPFSDVLLRVHLYTLANLDWVLVWASIHLYIVARPKFLDHLTYLIEHAFVFIFWLFSILIFIVWCCEFVGTAAQGHRYPLFLHVLYLVFDGRLVRLLRPGQSSISNFCELVLINGLDQIIQSVQTRLAPPGIIHCAVESGEDVVGVLLMEWKTLRAWQAAKAVFFLDLSHLPYFHRVLDLNDVFQRLAGFLSLICLIRALKLLVSRSRTSVRELTLMMSPLLIHHYLVSLVSLEVVFLESDRLFGVRCPLTLVDHDVTSWGITWVAYLRWVDPAVVVALR